VLGLEAASVFAIFISQIWNMTFSFYASLVTLPREFVGEPVTLVIHTVSAAYCGIDHRDRLGPRKLRGPHAPAGG